MKISSELGLGYIDHAYAATRSATPSFVAADAKQLCVRTWFIRSDVDAQDYETWCLLLLFLFNFFFKYKKNIF